MKNPNLQIYICRHGETAWTITGQHTGITDISLTEGGRKQAELLKQRLQNLSIENAYSSPRSRAVKTCEIAGFTPLIDPDIQEWNYGKFEGLTSSEIRKINPHWDLFADGAPGGESPQEVSARADRFLAKIKNRPGPLAIFSHGHFSRVLAARWLEVDVQFGKFLYVSPGSISLLGFEHNRPVLRFWNESPQFYT